MTDETTKMQVAESLVPLDEQVAKMQALVIQGDLGALNKTQQVMYIKQLCDSQGLNWATQPFAFMTLQGRTILYAKRDCADQLRRIHKISVSVAERVTVEEKGIHYVRVIATTPDGRQDEDIGVISIKGLQGENLANAIMKCTTKAKRRATLSMAGLGLPDESEVGDAPTPVGIDKPLRIEPELGRWKQDVGSVVEAEIIQIDRSTAETVTGPKPLPTRLPPATPPPVKTS